MSVPNKRTYTHDENSLNVDRLINFVSQVDYLYDTGTKLYRNSKLKNNAWSDIANLLNASPASCKLKWKNLLACRRREKRTRISESRSGMGQVTNRPGFAHYEQMSFLDKVKPSKKAKDSLPCIPQGLSLNGLASIYNTPKLSHPQNVQRNLQNHGLLDQNNGLFTHNVLNCKPAPLKSSDDSNKTLTPASLPFSSATVKVSTIPSINNPKPATLTSCSKENVNSTFPKKPNANVSVNSGRTNTEMVSADSSKENSLPPSGSSTTTIVERRTSYPVTLMPNSNVSSRLSLPLLPKSTSRNNCPSNTSGQNIGKSENFIPMSPSTSLPVLNSFKFNLSSGMETSRTHAFINPNITPTIMRFPVNTPTNNSNMSPAISNSSLISPFKSPQQLNRTTSEQNLTPENNTPPNKYFALNYEKSSGFNDPSPPNAKISQLSYASACFDEKSQEKVNNSKSRKKTDLNAVIDNFKNISDAFATKLNKSNTSQTTETSVNEKNPEIRAACEFWYQMLINLPVLERNEKIARINAVFFGNNK